MNHCQKHLFWIWAATLSAFALCFIAGAVFGQGTASISGAVRDEAGAGIAYAEVMVSGKTVRGEHKTTTDASGIYSLTGVPSGTYTLTVSASQFKTFVDQSVSLSPGVSLERDVVLRVGKLGIYDTFGIQPATDNSAKGVLTGVVADKADNAAIVTGAVTDAYMGMGIGNGQVQISGEGRTYTTQTLSNGDYMIKLSPGAYEIRVSAPSFCGGSRGAFSLKARADVRFDFELLVCGTINIAQVRPPPDPGAEVAPVLRDRYQQEQLAKISARLRPLVFFGSRDGNADLVHYSALVLLDRHFPVVYTYDLLTIKADTLTYSQKDNSVRGAGNVIWQDGKTTRHGSSIDLTFRDGEPHVQLRQ